MKKVFLSCLFDYSLNMGTCSMVFKTKKAAEEYSTEQNNKIFNSGDSDRFLYYVTESFMMNQ